MENQLYSAIDVGGTSINCGVVNGQGHIVVPACRYPAHSDAQPSVFTAHLVSIIRAALEGTKKIYSRGFTQIAIAFPGPCDYETGTPLMRGLCKFEGLYGFPLRDALLDRLPAGSDVRFANDADLYCIGECFWGQGKGFDRVMAVCIGTGIGSGFYANGRLLKTGEGVPPNGWIYETPYQGDIADHVISATGLRRLIKAQPGLEHIPDVKELADAARAGNQAAKRLWDRFGHMFCDIITPYAIAFGAQRLVVGGDVARSFDLFSAPIARVLENVGISVVSSRLFSQNTLLAAPLLFGLAE